MLPALIKVACCGYCVQNMQQKGANALPPKQVMPAAAESSEEDSSEEEVSCKLDSVLYVRNYVSKTT